MDGLPDKGRHIGTVDPEISLCTGCNACEIVCSLLHDGYISPRNRRIYVKKDDVNLFHHVYTCVNCDDSPCYEACPLQDEAMRYDEVAGVAYVNAEACIGCGLCVKACPYEPKRIQMSLDKKAVKCDLCHMRVEGPACIEYCNAMVIGIAGERVPTAQEGACYA